MQKFKGGTVQVANDVIDVIIASTALKVDDVEAVRGYDEKKNRLQMGADKYIQTQVEGGILSTDIMISVVLNRPIVDIVEDVQKSIISQVESMLGLKCKDINVTVTARK